MIIHNHLYTYVTENAEPAKIRLKTDFIVVHHAGAIYQKGNACRAIFNFHSQKWPKYGRIGYHIVLQEEVDNSITMQIVNPLGIVGANVAQRNHQVVGICAATNFLNVRQPEQKWLDAIRFSLQYVQNIYPLARVVGHKDIALPEYATTCPGNYWDSWKHYVIPKDMTQTYVIGVKPSCTLAQFRAFLVRRNAPITVEVIERIYTLAQWLDIDPAFLAALWYAEQGSSNHALGDTAVGRATRNPLNIKAYGRWPHVSVGGVMWNQYESWQLGLMHGIMHLKQIYGASGLLTVEQIIPVFAPVSDGNKPQAYINRLLATMHAIKEIKV
jgi:hypothetical protein